MRSDMPPDRCSNITAAFQAAIARALREAVDEIPPLVGRTLSAMRYSNTLEPGAWERCISLARRCSTAGSR